MLTTPKRALLETVRTYANDSDASAWEDHKNDALYIDVDFGTGNRRLKFDHTSQHDLGALDEQQRTDVVAGLFANATSWPEGTAEVRCLLDVLQTPAMMNHTDFRIFVGDVAVSQGVRISTQMNVKP